MKIARMNWMQIEEYLKSDDRCVLPLGCLQQHAYLSVSTDSILAERVAADAAQPLGVPVYPALPYGLSTRFMAFPGTVTFRPDTYVRVIRDVLDSLVESGFRRVLIVNGPGENAPARETSRLWADSRPGVQVRFHDWWAAPRTREKLQAIDPVGGHGSWPENFPWARLPGVELPEKRKNPVQLAENGEVNPKRIRDELGDGSFGGRYWRPEEQMMELWVVAVAETRALLEDPWR